jgi:ABC-type sugar transport system substrate-binding protein
MHEPFTAEMEPNMNSKRLPLVGLLAVIALTGAAAAGCGGSSSGSSGSSDSSSSSPAKSSGQLKVGFSLPALDEYYSVVQQAAEKEAKAKGIELITGDGVSGASPTVQISKVQNLLAQGIKVLLISPQGTGLIPVLNRAVSQGVKVIFIDQNIPAFTDALSFIGTDNAAGSAVMGNYLVKELGGKGEVGVMLGVPGTPTSQARSGQLTSILKSAGIKVSNSSQPDTCQEATAINVFRTFLVSHPDVDAMFSICGPTGQAVDKVLAERKGGKKIISTSWDVEIQQIKNILAGTENAAIAQFPVKLGTSAVDWAIKVNGGATIPKVIDNGTQLVTKDNAGDFFHDADSGYSYLTTGTQ